MTDDQVQAALVAKLRADAALSPPVLASLSDQAAADALNAIDPTLATTRAVSTPVKSAAGALLVMGVWQKISIRARDAVLDDALGECCVVIHSALTNPNVDTLSTDDTAGLAAITAALSGLVAASIITSDQKAGLLSLGVLPVDRSWADVNIEGRHVSAAQITTARATIAGGG